MARHFTSWKTSYATHERVDTEQFLQYAEKVSALLFRISEILTDRFHYLHSANYVRRSVPLAGARETCFTGEPGRDVNMRVSLYCTGKFMITSYAILHRLDVRWPFSFSPQI